MKVRVNGEEREVEREATVLDLVRTLGLASGPVAVERNGTIVRRALHGETRLEEGDVVEIVHFVGGG